MPPKRTRKRGAKNSTALTSSHNPNNHKPRPSSSNTRTLLPQPSSTLPGRASHLSKKPSNVTLPDHAPVNICPICAGPAKDWAVGHCTHVVCGDCSHRMRVLYARKTCAMCNAQLNQVVVVPLRHYREDMDFEAAVALPAAFQDKQVEMWFLDRGRHQQLKNVRGWKCSHRYCTMKGAQESIFANSAQLRAHAKVEHRAIYCEICFAGSKCFISELKPYTMDADRNYSSRLRGHLRKDHPQCKFCREYFLDDEKLYAHLQEAHETCSICERAGRMHEYYVNYDQLENHYRKEHYVCGDEGCRGVVFASQIELQTHEHTRHPDSSRSSRARALRVNLQQLHGDRDTRLRDLHSPGNVRIEQERQTARRQAFLSSSVVFSGALNFDDAPIPTASYVSSNNNNIHASQTRGSSSSSARPSSSTTATTEIRRPDDGHFYPLDPPRDADEALVRNKILVKSMRSTLDPAAYEQFRMSSGEFHSGKITADQYYDAVIDAFGVRAAVRDIFPELVALLPAPVLREPLHQTCLQRTDTKLNGISSFEAPGSGAGPSSQGREQEEQFPSLTGNAGPARVPPPPMRRFGAPGPEEFPRLNRANKPQGEVSAVKPDAPMPSSSSKPSSSKKPKAKPSASATPSNAQAQRTAASIVKESRTMQCAIPQQRPAVASRQAGSSSAVKFSASSFPALGPGAKPTAAPPPPASVYGRNGPRVNESDGFASQTPNPDVSLRVGAVWGGAASQGRGGKKRGPGRGRRPASPPKHMLQGSRALPGIRSSTDSESSSTASTDVAPNSNGRQAKVIDVMEIAKSRRNALQKSSLPKVGGSGYGFAWERKKAQQKRRQIKSDMQQANENNNSIKTRDSGGVKMNSIGNTATNLVSSIGTEASSSSQVEVVVGSTSASGLEEADNLTAESRTDSAEVEPGDFGRPSYPKRDTDRDDAVAVPFLGNGNSGNSRW